MYNVRGELVTQRVENQRQDPGLGFTVPAMTLLRSSHHTNTLLHHYISVLLLLPCYFRTATSALLQENEFNSIRVIAQGIYIAVYTPVYCIPLALHADQENHCRKRKRSRTNGKILNPKKKKKNMAL